MSNTQHNFKKVMSHDTGEWLLCCWMECEKLGTNAHIAVQRTTEEGYDKTIKYVFCSEKHKEYFKNSHLKYGFTA